MVVLVVIAFSRTGNEDGVCNNRISACPVPKRYVGARKIYPSKQSLAATEAWGCRGSTPRTQDFGLLTVDEAGV